VALLASRMAFDAYGSTDTFAAGIFALAMVLGYVMGGFSNFFLRRPFVSDAVFSVVLLVTVAFVVINFYNKEGKPQEFATGVDWGMVPAAVLILFALWILAGLALACSTRFDMIPTLAICYRVFSVGHHVGLSLWNTRGKGLLVGLGALHDHAKLAAFWFADAIEMGKSEFHWGYVGKAFAYVVAYVGAALAVAIALFEDRELS